MIEALDDTFRKLSTNMKLLEDEMFADVHVNKEDVLKNMIYQAELYLKWARMSVIAEATCIRWKEHINHEIWPLVRPEAQAVVDEYVKKHGGRATIDQVNVEVYKNPLYVQANKSLQKAEEVVNTFKKMENAMWQRKDMLQSLNSRQKAEFSDYDQDTELEALKETVRHNLH